MLSKKQIDNLKRGNVSADSAKTKARVTKDYLAASTADKKAIRELASAPNFNSVVAKSGTISAKYVIAIAQTLKVSPYYYTGESDDKTFADGIMDGFLKKHSEKKTASVKATEKKPTAAKVVEKKPAAKKATAKPTASKPKAAKATPKADAKKPVAKATKVKPLKAEPKAKPANKKAAPAKVAKPAPVKKPRVVKTAPVAPAVNDSVLATIQIDNSVKMNKAVKDLSEDNAVILLKALSYKAKAGGNAEVLYDLIKRCLLT
jgi:hypothetical protein